MTDSERYPIAKLIDGRGLGVVVSLGVHFSTIEFDEAGHRWTIVVENDEFEIVDYIGRNTID